LEKTEIATIMIYGMGERISVEKARWEKTVD
jgi:hypothetical protein